MEDLLVEVRLDNGAYYKVSWNNIKNVEELEAIAEIERRGVGAAAASVSNFVDF